MLILLLERIEKTQRFSQWWLQVWLYFTWSNHYQISIIWQRILTQNLFSVLINHGKATPGLITLTHFLLSPFPTCLPLFCGCLCTLCHIINFKWWKNQATVDKNHWIFFFFFAVILVASFIFLHMHASQCQSWLHLRVWSVNVMNRVFDATLSDTCWQSKWEKGLSEKCFRHWGPC